MINASGIYDSTSDGVGDDRRNTVQPNRASNRVERNTGTRIREFAALCSALEMAEQGKDPIARLQAEQALRVFYAQSSEEEQSVFRTFLEQQQEGAGIADHLRLQFHERMINAAALPFKTTAAFLAAVTPASITISYGAAKLAAGTLLGAARGFYHAGKAAFSRN